MKQIVGWMMVVAVMAVMSGCKTWECGGKPECKKAKSCCEVKKECCGKCEKSMQMKCEAKKECAPKPACSAEKACEAK